MTVIDISLNPQSELDTLLGIRNKVSNFLTLSFKRLIDYSIDAEGFTDMVIFKCNCKK